MNRSIIWLLALALTTPVFAATLDDLSWMAGHWANRADGASSEEVWTAPAGGIMLGLHRDVRRDGRAFFEFLRIEERDDTINYIAQPSGKAGTAFALTSIEDGTKVVFENPGHDFPQRIVYWLEDGKLCARAEAIPEPGKGPQWCWEKE